MICYILYMGANFYAIWGTIVPSAIILGFGAAPLWSAKCTYLTQTATWYAKMTGATVDDIINRFFGVFFMVFQTSMYKPYISSALRDLGNITLLMLVNMFHDLFKQCKTEHNWQVRCNRHSFCFDPSQWFIPGPKCHEKSCAQTQCSTRHIKILFNLRVNVGYLKGYKSLKIKHKHTSCVIRILYQTDLAYWT